MKRVDRSTKKIFLIACCFQTFHTFNYTCTFKKYFTNATKCDFTNANKCDFNVDFMGSKNVILIWIFQYHLYCNTQIIIIYLFLETSVNLADNMQHP